MANPFKEMQEELEKQAREAEQSKRELDKKLEKLIAEVKNGSDDR